MLGMRKKEPVVEFCDRCGSVCDEACRAASVREQARAKTYQFGPRI